MWSIAQKFLKSKLGIAGIISMILGGVLVVKEIKIRFLRAEVQTLEASNKELTVSINEQNLRVDQLENDAQSQAKEAELAALRSIRKAEETRKKLQNAETGPGVMNLWIKDLYQ